jgi:hypothetical protein
MVLGVVMAQLLQAGVPFYIENATEDLVGNPKIVHLH